MSKPLSKLVHRHHFTHAETYDRRAGKLFRGVYRSVAEDVAAAAPAGGVVLDAGCGSGRLAVEIAKRRPDLRLDGIDMEPGMVDEATRHAERENLTDRVEFTVADLADLPLPDESVDLIVSTASLDHWTNVGAVIASLDRVLRLEAGSASTTSAGSPREACAPPLLAGAAASTEPSSAPDGSPPLSSNVSRSRRCSRNARTTAGARRCVDAERPGVHDVRREEDLEVEPRRRGYEQQICALPRGEPVGLGGQSEARASGIQLLEVGRPSPPDFAISERAGPYKK
jgi:SAM-dependent methyltransferase